MIETIVIILVIEGIFLLYVCVLEYHGPAIGTDLPLHYAPKEGIDFGYPLKPQKEGFHGIDGHEIRTHESKCKSPDYICDGTLKHCNCYGKEDS